MRKKNNPAMIAAAFSGIVLVAMACWFTNTGDPASAQAGNTVSINNTQFEPKTLTLSKGSTVTWMNKEAKPHTVTADDNSFSSKVMKEGETYSYKFEQPGTYAYHCAFHGGNAGKGMAGTIVVK